MPKEMVQMPESSPATTHPIPLELTKSILGNMWTLTVSSNSKFHELINLFF
jgi:hypothetical protein